MGKRLLRIRTPDVPERLPALVSRELDLVLGNGRTLHGRLLEAADGRVVVRDNIGHLHSLAVADIEEVIADQTAPF